MSLTTEEQPPGLLYLPNSPQPHPTPVGDYERPEVTTTTASPPLRLAGHHKSSTVTGMMCAVCSEVSGKDAAFRKHYGVVCCEACKCFFRRTVQMSRDYKCRYDGNCTIGRFSENMKQVCQACRFSQCIRAGMKVESVKKFPRKGGGGEGGGGGGGGRSKEALSGDIENGGSGAEGRETDQGARFQKVMKNFSKSKKKTRVAVSGEEANTISHGTSHMKQEREEGEVKYSGELLLEPAPSVPSQEQQQLFSSGGLEPGGGRSSPGHSFQTNGVHSNSGYVTSLHASFPPPHTTITATATGKRTAPDSQTMDTKKMRLEAALSQIRPLSPTSLPAHLSGPFSPPPLPQTAPYTPPSFQHPPSYTYSHHSSMVNSPESHPPSVYNSHTNTPYATPHETPVPSPLPSPTALHPPPSLQPYSTPPPSSLLTPISLPAAFTRRNNLLLSQNPGTVFLNSTSQMPFHVLPMAQPILPFMTSFPSFTPHMQTCSNDITASPSPFSIVPIPSSSITRVSQPDTQVYDVELPQPSLPPTDIRREVEESLASAPPSAHNSPEPPPFPTRFITDSNTFPEAEVDEVLDSLRQRIRTMFSWAKYDVAGFEDLSPLDQKALLRRTVAELVMLGFARASIAYNGVLLLGKTGKAIRPTNINSGVSAVASVTLKKLVEPLKVVNMDDKEYSLLLEIVLFNPESSCLRNREVVRAHRKRSHISLKEYSDKQSAGDLGRFGELMCLLTPLFEVSTEVTEQLRLEHFVHEGEARIDALLLMSMINGAEEVGAA